MKTFDALVLTNGRLELRRVPEGYEALRNIVGGYIEMPYISEELNNNGISIIINEEGKLIDGMQKEIAVISKSTNEVVDIVFGNCVFTGFNEHGETISITKEQIDKVIEILSNKAILNDNSIVRVMYI